MDTQHGQHVPFIRASLVSANWVGLLMSITSDQLFLSAGMQYYIAGRFAAIAQLNPVAANLLHHAVEMCLKGALAKQGSTLKTLKSFDHDLPRLWDAFKTQAGDPALQSFDEVVTALHSYESIRYPGPVPKEGKHRKEEEHGVLKEGMLSGIGVGKRPTTPMIVGGGAQSVPAYEMWLGEIDELIHKVLVAASVNPQFLISNLRTEARKYLSEQNCATVFKARTD